MKFTYNWLKDFVDLKISPQVLAERLTMAGIEVGSVEERGGDFVFEIEITSNRPDWLSIAGIAREAAAITGKGLKPRKPTNPKIQKSPEKIKVVVENKKDCPLYSAKIITGVKVGPSPDWLSSRLEAVGCRSINNVVDITNYILFECGQPLHAFDLGKLNSGTVIVRRAKAGEKIVTIDDQEKALDPEILVIADQARPAAIAGVMGGKATEVGTGTKNILLEAAVFSPIVVRRGRQRLGLQSESSYRFERGVDAENLEQASLRAVALFQEICGGKLAFTKSCGSANTEKVTINLSLADVQRILGCAVPSTKIRAILSHLGFKVKGKGKNIFSVGVPSYRQDVKQGIDLIEEIVRVFGYERVPTTLPAIMPQIGASGTRGLVNSLKDILVGLGAQEVITYSLVDQGLLKGFGCDGRAGVEIANPLNKEQGVLRPTILPSLVKCVSHNLNQKENYVNIFEVSKVFHQSGNSVPEESLVLGLAVCGTKSWLFEQGLVKDEAGPLHLKGMLETVFSRLGIRDYAFIQDHPAGAIGVSVKQTSVGGIKIISPALLNSLEIKNRTVAAAEISLDRLFQHVDGKKSFVRMPVYPGIYRDISFILREEIPAEQILSAVKEKGGQLLREVKIVDYYKGKQIPSGYKGLTISCLYRSDERTLTEEEITPLHNAIAAALGERLGVKIR